MAGAPAVQPARPTDQSGQAQQEYSLRKYLLLLATLVITVTYAAGFNPPGGVWQVTHDGQLAGDPIIRVTHYRLYLVFFYCNAAAFAASLVVIVLILALAVRHDKRGKGTLWVVVPLRFVMVVDLLSLMGAYGAGTCRDKISTVYSVVLVTIVFLYILVLKVMDCWDENSDSDAGTIPAAVASSDGGMPVSNGNTRSGGVMPTPNSDSNAGTIPATTVGENEWLRHRKALKDEERLRKILMLLATFAVSITYVAGLSTPGGFWDSTGGSHRPGDEILKDHHGPRLTVFLLCNTTAFVASLLITMLLIADSRKLHSRPHVLYVCIVVALVSLIGAYATGSCRKTDTTAKVVGLAGAVLALACILLRTLNVRVLDLLFPEKSK